MCYPFREDVKVDLLTSKIAALIHLNTSAVEDEILIVQAIMSSSLGLMENVGTYSQNKSIQTSGNVLTP